MMMGPSSRVAVLSALVAAACSTADNTVDPGDLELRDLLGISPEIASSWTTTQRIAARRVLLAGLSLDGGPPRAAAAPSTSAAPRPAAPVSAESRPTPAPLVSA